MLTLVSVSGDVSLPDSIDTIVKTDHVLGFEPMDVPLRKGLETVETLSLWLQSFHAS